MLILTFTCRGRCSHFIKTCDDFIGIAREIGTMPYSSILGHAVGIRQRTEIFRSRRPDTLNQMRSDPWHGTLFRAFRANYGFLQYDS